MIWKLALFCVWIFSLNSGCAKHKKMLQSEVFGVPLQNYDKIINSQNDPLRV